MPASNPPRFVGFRVFSVVWGFCFLVLFLHPSPTPRHNEACLTQCYAMDLGKNSFLVSATQFFFNAVYSLVNSLCKI